MALTANSDAEQKKHNAGSRADAHADSLNSRRREMQRQKTCGVEDRLLYR
jgi:hypothetical protein